MRINGEQAQKFIHRFASESYEMQTKNIIPTVTPSEPSESDTNERMKARARE